MQLRTELKQHIFMKCLFLFIDKYYINFHNMKNKLTQRYTISDAARYLNCLEHIRNCTVFHAVYKTGT